MRNNHVIAASLLTLSLTVAGCAEVQRAGEDIARQSGNPRLAGAIHGVGNVVGSLFPIGYEEESSIGQATSSFS
jgi:predicted small secreted protein